MSKLGASSATYVTEQGQHFIVGRIIRNEKPQIRIVQDSSNSNQASTSTGHDGYILPGVLAFFPLAVMGVIQGSDGQSERFDTGSGTVLSRVHGDINRLWALKAARDLEKIYKLAGPSDLSRVNLAIHYHLTRVLPGRDWPRRRDHPESHARWLSRCTTPRLSRHVRGPSQRVGGVPHEHF